MLHAMEGLKTIENLTIYGNAPIKSGALSFLFNGVHPADVGMILDKQGIAVRTRTHCTEPIMQHYGIPGTVRASFGLYTTVDEIDVLVNTLIQNWSNVLINKIDILYYLDFLSLSSTFEGCLERLRLHP